MQQKPVNYKEVLGKIQHKLSPRALGFLMQLVKASTGDEDPAQKDVAGPLQCDLQLVGEEADPGEQRRTGMITQC